MKNIIYLLVFFATSSIAFGQVEKTKQRKNSIKINILPPLLSATGEISYELIVKPKLGVVLGFGGNFRADQSDFQLDSESDLEFLDRDIKNLYFLAEVRRYIDFCNGNCNAPHGFYAGGFMRYNQLDYSANPHFEDGDTNLDFDMEIDLRSFNFGALFGYQIVYKNWIVDFEFGGLGYSPNWINFSSSSELSNDALANLSEALNENFGIGGNYEDLELNSSDAELSFWTWTFRYAVSVGYNF